MSSTHWQLVAGQIKRAGWRCNYSERGFSEGGSFKAIARRPNGQTLFVTSKSLDDAFNRLWAMIQRMP